MKIGSHSLAHESYGRLSLEAAREDAVQSKQQLEQHLSYSVESFAYPFGTKSDYNDDVAKLLEESGYKVAFTSLHGSIQETSIQETDSLLKLPRVKVESGETIRAYERLTKGAMDAWAFVDTYLSSLQANR